MVITFLTMYNKSLFFAMQMGTKKYESKYFTVKKYIKEDPAYRQ